MLTEQTVTKEQTQPASESEETPAHEELQAEIAALQEENRRLRREYARSRQRQYRRTAIGLGIVGMVAIVASVLFPAQQTLLLALGGTGVFGAILTYYLTPEQFVPVSISEEIDRGRTATLSQIRENLDLTDKQVFVPTPEQEYSTRVFLPQRDVYQLPAAETLSSVFVTGANRDQRGLSLVPAGEYLYAEFTKTVNEMPAEEPVPAVGQLADAAVEVFELADQVSVDTVENESRIIVEGTNVAYGELNQPEHPVVSLLGVGLARAIDQPIEVVIEDAEADDGVISLRWNIQQEQ